MLVPTGTTGTVHVHVVREYFLWYVRHVVHSTTRTLMNNCYYYGPIYDCSPCTCDVDMCMIWASYGIVVKCSPLD